MEDIYSLPAGLLHMQVVDGPTVYYLFSCVAFFVSYVYSSKTKSQAAAIYTHRDIHIHITQRVFGNTAVLQLTISPAI